jgi:hypothetical protein
MQSIRCFNHNIKTPASQASIHKDFRALILIILERLAVLSIFVGRMSAALSASSCVDKDFIRRITLR